MKPLKTNCHVGKEHPPRTTAQNRAMWKYCRTMAELLNDAGYDFKQFLEVCEYKLDVPWTGELFKEQVWDIVLKALKGKDSTTEMDTVDPSEIHRIVDARMAELTGVSAEFPSNR